MEEKSFFALGPGGRSYRITCEYDGVVGARPPQLDEVDNVPEPETRVPAKHDARLKSEKEQTKIGESSTFC